MTREEFEEATKELSLSLMDYAEEVKFEMDKDEFLELEEGEWSGKIKIRFHGKDKFWEVPVRSEQSEVVIPTHEDNYIDFDGEGVYSWIFFEAEAELWKAEQRIEKLLKDKEQ